MSYQELGDFQEAYRSIDTIDARQIRSGELQSVEIILTGGTKGIIRSEDYTAGTGGWKIDAAGNAEFNNVTVRGVIDAGAGSDVDWSYISNVTIDNADITDLSFSKITAGSNTASLTIGSGGDIRSSNFSAGSAGFRVLGTGSAEFNDVTVRGSIASGSAGERVSISSGGNDISFYDSGGTLVGIIDSSTSTFKMQSYSSGQDISIVPATSGSINLSVANAFGGAQIKLSDYVYITNATDMVWQAGGSNNLNMGSRPINSVLSLSGTMGSWNSTTLSANGDITATGEIRSNGAGTASNNHFQCENAGTGMSNSGGVLKFATSSTFRTQLGSSFWGPQTDNNISSGANGARWTAVWAADGAIQTSDLREKNVLEDSPVPGLSFINQLDPFKYTWKWGDTDHVHWGVAAQQVQKLVGNEGPLRADNPDMLALNYAELVPALIVAVQELSAKLEAYEAR